MMILFAFKEFYVNYNFEIISIAIILILLSVVWSQSKENKELKEKMKASMSEEFSDEIINQTKKVLNTSGDIKAIKFLRENTGMSLLEAKQRVDTLK